MRGIQDYKLAALQAENAQLKKLIIQAKKKRIEASYYAEQLAEANFYLENCLCDVYLEINNLKLDNGRMVAKKQHHCPFVQ